MQFITDNIIQVHSGKTHKAPQYSSVDEQENGTMMLKIFKKAEQFNGMV